MKKNWIKKKKQIDLTGIEPTTGNRIGNLDITIPFTTDPISQGDDHIRAIKRAMQGSFPLIGTTPVTLTAPQWNHADERISVGLMTYFDERLGPIPEGWALCDGGLYNGFQTIDLRSYFIKARGEDVVGTPGGLNTAAPVPTGVYITEAQTPNHNHTGQWDHQTSGSSIGDGDSGSGYGLSNTDVTYPTSSVWGGADGVTADIHNHIVTPYDNQPAFMTMQFIVYVGIA